LKQSVSKDKVSLVDDVFKEVVLMKLILVIYNVETKQKWMNISRRSI